jgi:hypothetical protein
MVTRNGFHYFYGFPKLLRKVSTYLGMGALHLVIYCLPNIMEEAGPPRLFDI